MSSIHLQIVRYLCQLTIAVTSSCVASLFSYSVSPSISQRRISTLAAWSLLTS